MTTQYHDRFSEAEKELPEKSAFICKICDKKYPHTHKEGMVGGDKVSKESKSTN